MKDKKSFTTMDIHRYERQEILHDFSGNTKFSERTEEYHFFLENYKGRTTDSCLSMRWGGGVHWNPTEPLRKGGNQVNFIMTPPPPPSPQVPKNGLSHKS